MVLTVVMKQGWGGDVACGLHDPSLRHYDGPCIVEEAQDADEKAEAEGVAGAGAYQPRPARCCGGAGGRASSPPSWSLRIRHLPAGLPAVGGRGEGPAWREGVGMGSLRPPRKSQSSRVEA